MSTHPRPDSLLGAWHAQVAETAAKTPWLVQDLIRRKGELLPKFAAYYQQLRALPRRTRRLLQRRFAQTLAGAALLLALGNGQAIAATITVGGSCLLVDAITAANTDSATGGCSAGSGADTLVLPASSTQLLTSVNNTTYGATGLPVITSSITIEGNGSTITRDSGAAAFRIFAIGSGGELTLQETTVSGGVAAGGGVTAGARNGGGVYNRFGTLTLVDSTITGNRAGVYGRGGGVFTLGTTTLSNSTITGNSADSGGGGLANFGYTVTLTNSTISGNSAYFGGGVANRDGRVTLSNSTITGNRAVFGGGLTNDSGTVTLTNSTITGNSADFGGGVGNYSGTVTLTNSTITGNRAGVGGGVYTRNGTVTLTNSTITGNRAGRGGGVYTRNGTVTLTNSTITGNSAGVGGGVYTRNGTVTLTNSTITGNSALFYGGGLANFYGTVTLSRTLLAGNTASSGAEVYNTGGTITVDNFNLLGHAGVSQAAAFTDFLPGATDLNAATGCTTPTCTPTALSAILAPLALHAPGVTETHALPAGSPAIDASPADADCQPTDQRGVPRPQGAACDIGAYEAGSGPVHDLAVVKVASPKVVTLTSKKPVQSKTVKVQLQNQGEVNETIPSAAILASLVQVDLESLDTVNDCPDVAATLDASKLKFPLTLKAGKTPLKGKKLTVSFTVTFDRNECIPDPGKSSKNDPGHEDYRPSATVDLSALGETDVDPTDDMLEGALIDVIDKP